MYSYALQFVNENLQRWLNWLSRNMRYSTHLTDTVRFTISEWVLRHMIGVEFAPNYPPSQQSLMRTARALPVKQRARLMLAPQHQTSLLPNADERTSAQKLLIHMVTSSPARATLYHIGQKDMLRVVTSKEEMDKSVRTFTAPDGSAL